MRTPNPIAVIAAVLVVAVTFIIIGAVQETRYIKANFHCPAPFTMVAVRDAGHICVIRPIPNR